MNLIDAMDRACEMETVEDAMAFICDWECERVIKEAHEFLSGKKERNPDGTGWSSCFKYLLTEVRYCYTIKRLKGGK